MYEQKIPVEHQECADCGEDAAELHERARGGDDADRLQHDRDLEQRLGEVEIRVALGGMVALGLEFLGLGEGTRSFRRLR